LPQEEVFQIPQQKPNCSAQVKREIASMYYTVKVLLFKPKRQSIKLHNETFNVRGKEKK
jgi:hypothetical protein